MSFGANPGPISKWASAATDRAFRLPYPIWTGRGSSTSTSLQLSGSEDRHDGSRIYTCAGETSLHVYESPEHAGKTTATLATWHVTDIERLVDELGSIGVTFEQFDEPRLKTDKRGIHSLDDGKVAWFRDPDGNTLAVEQ
jgi:hypothetical protein